MKMFGFVKTDKYHRINPTGGAIIRKKKKVLNIVLIVFGIIAFAILNLVLYSLTSV
jgi:hypothetical protein